MERETIVHEVILAYQHRRVEKTNVVTKNCCSEAPHVQDWSTQSSQKHKLNITEKRVVHSHRAGVGWGKAEEDWS
jgi:hypothetical protein